MSLIRMGKSTRNKWVNITQYTDIFHGRKNGNFWVKKCYIFLIFAQNTDCGYTLKCYIFLIFAQNTDCGYTLEPPH